MAIRIPSSKTYERQNPKVMDNVIERIEVGTVEVVSNNKYNENVFLKSYNSNEINILGGFGDKIDGSQAGKEYAGSVYSNGYGVVYLEITPYYLPSGIDDKITIIIPKKTKNSFIDKINTGSTTLGNNIGVSFEYKKYIGIAKGVCYISDGGSSRSFDITEKIIEDIPKNNKTSNISIDFTNEFTWESEYVEGQYHKQNIDISEKFNLKNLDNIAKANVRQDEDNFYIDLKILCGYERIALGGYTPPKAGGTPSNEVTINLSGNVEIFEPITIELTFKGDKIGIDLQDKTVYINGETQKKVHSVDGNELMQTTNYLLDGGVNAIETMYGETRKEYERGKETATIRCSIGDYYDYDSGEKMIAIDNSTGKMSFKMYDQIIPMVYGADGKDRPMSIYQDGSPKVFQVLGSKIFYDGAVWQELSLQELDKSEIV